MAALSPKGEGAGGEGRLDVDEALVAAAAEAEGDVALCHLEGAVNEDVKLADHIQQLGFMDDFFPGVAGVAPDLVAQFCLDAVDEGTSAVGLLQGVTAAEGDGSLVIGDDLHQLVKRAFLPTQGVPRVRVVAPRTMVIAARQID